MEKLLISLLRAAFIHCRVNNNLLEQKLAQITNHEYKIELVNTSKDHITYRLTNDLCIKFILVNGIVKDICIVSEK